MQIDDEVKAWQELSRRIRFYNRVASISLLLVLVGFFGMIRRHTPPFELVLLMFLLTSLYFACLFMAASIANKFRCPNCGQQFMKIDAGAKDGLQDVKYFGHEARCQHCEFEIANPK